MDWPDPLTGEQQIIHSDKGNFVRTTSLSEFAAGEMVHILWVPQTWDQQNSRATEDAQSGWETL